MLLSGFTFIRNAIKYDYPFKECVQSILPLVDELIINVGKSEDETGPLVQRLAQNQSKIRLIHSIWDDQKTKEGLVLSEQTNLALKECRGKWAFYLQADEALHENEYEAIRSRLEAEQNSPSSIDAFRFKYLHFYGGYQTIQQPWNWYSTEIRLIRNNGKILSFGDAQSFRDLEGRLPSSEVLNAHIYHYGHARDPESMKKKIFYFHRFWHGDRHQIKVENAYQVNWKNLVWFWASHPKVYASKIKNGEKWSLKPENLPFSTDAIDTVAVYCTPKTKELAVELTREIEKLQKFKKVEILEGYKDWSKAVIRNLGKRKKSILIDLDAETRSLLHFFFWVQDAFASFGIRIAHVPSGKLSRFRKACYSFIHWGQSEDSLGFCVSPDSYTSQILKWLKLEVVNQTSKEINTI